MFELFDIEMTRLPDPPEPPRNDCYALFGYWSRPPEHWGFASRDLLPSLAQAESAAKDEYGYGWRYLMICRIPGNQTAPVLSKETQP